ncbi:MAG TPA: NAD-dependent DNA ligase LigA [Thermoanaerobaculia bacterium]|nr:NAD-dependent DNA ligase LigA [Thermoanaerobaculia bacterium]
MTRDQAAKRIAKLRSEIRHHEYLYYVEDKPAISDEEFDRLFHELEDLEAKYPDLVSEDSPTQRVAGSPLDSFPTVEHAAPMLSLDSSQDEDNLRRFDERLRKALGDTPVEYVLEPKLDGLSMELVYRDGVLVQAVTRGDGRKGEGVTANVRTIASVPLKLRESERPAPPFLSVRGEIIMFVKDFDRLNERLMAEGKEPFASPRNSAAGTVRQLDPQLTASRPLHMYAYDILASEGLEGIETQWDVLQALRAWGLKVNERIKKGKTFDDILAYHKGFEAERDDLGYEIDGVVIKLNDLADRETLGWTSRHPRWAYAFKFPPRKEVTRILSILPSVGRTGVVTPVAIMLPVEIGGVTVARATLHNREEVARKDVREGDRVRVQRAGDVIPQVIERIEEPGHERSPEWRMPDVCPSCGTRLIERGPFTVCPNSFECPAQLAGRIVHFASRDALDIEGLGDETSKLFVAEGLVKQLPDLFEIRPEQLVVLEGFAQKSANKLVDALKKACSAAELPRFLYGLGIPEVGVAVARDLARHFGTFARLRAADEAALQEVPGVGPRMAEQITAFFREPSNAEVLDELTARMHLVETEPEPSGGGDGAVKLLAGQKWVFTGGLTHLTRRDAQGYVESLGARATGSVSKSTDVVVVGEDAGSKAEDARKLGVRTMNEEEFLAFLRGNGISI